MIPLSAVAHFTQGATPLAVNHQGLLVANTISFNLPPNVSLSTAVATIEAAMNRIGVPATIRGTFQGTAKAFQDSLSNQPYLILAALVTIYIVLGVLYESYVHPLTILSTLPSAGVGALLALMAFRTEFSIMALIGVILLIGIVKKNAIMMIDFALEAERKRGLSPLDAIYEACLLRFRPIMMTTMAAMLGALPLAIGMGDGGELRQPLGIAIVGGLILSQVLTLYSTPVIYLYMDRFRFWSQRLQGRRHGTAGARCHAATGRIDVSKRFTDDKSEVLRQDCQSRRRRSGDVARQDSAAAGVRIASRISALLLGPALSGCILGSERPELNLDVPATYREASPRAPDAAASGAGLVARLPVRRTDVADGSGADLQSRYRGRHCPDRPGRRAGREYRVRPCCRRSPEPRRPSAYAMRLRRRRLAQRPTTFSQYNLGLTASYMVDFWGKNRATLYAAEESATVARYNREVVTLTTIVTVANTYFQVLAAQDQLRVARRNLAAAERILTLIKQQFAGGTASQLDLSQQEALVATERAAIPPLEITLRQNIAALALLVARAPANFTVIGGTMAQIAVPRVTPGMPSELLYQRPDIRQAEAQLASSNFSVEAARAAFFPADTVDRSNRRAERGAGLAVRTGRLVLHPGRGTDPAAVRRLPAGEPVEAGQGRAAAKSCRPTARRCCRPSPMSRRRWWRCRKSTLQERLQAEAVANSRKAFEVSETQLRAGTVNLHHRAADPADAAHRREHAGAGAADQIAGGQQPVPGAGRRMDAARNAVCATAVKARSVAIPMPVPMRYSPRRSRIRP